MTNVVNLRMARKRKARAEKEQAAGENRALHGQIEGRESCATGCRPKNPPPSSKATGCERAGRDESRP